MIASSLPSSSRAAVVASGELVAMTEKWAVTTDVDVTYIYPTLPSGKSIRVTHLSHKVTCHSLVTGSVVVFRRAKTHWHDSRRAAARMRRKEWHLAPTEDGHDFRGDTIHRRDVTSELARLGAGDSLARRIVAWAESRSKCEFGG